MSSLSELIKKYDVPTPRYTSYPPVPYWQGAPTQSEWLAHVKANYDPTQGLDVYIHVPYCESLCYYCGCHRVITKNHAVEDPFVDTLIAEWQIYEKALGGAKVASVHFGGGTPTFLSPANLSKLLRAVTKHKSVEFTGSIEVDPRTCTGAHVEVLKEFGIRRISLGIQDFDPTVQKAIHRDQSFKLVEGLVEKLRASGIEALNFDLIYGLPNQTIETVTNTIQLVGELRPDTIAFYSYAHLPERMKHQKLIDHKALPSGEKKRALYDAGRAHLEKLGYVDVGMDHFALPGSPLAKAKAARKLQRNFMGYVEKKTPVLIGLGPSSISDATDCFVQNLKEVEAWKDAVRSGHLPFDKGHAHSSSDLVIQRVIQEIMCNGCVAESLAYEVPGQDAIERGLAAFESDGVIARGAGEIRITRAGLPFLRNVAALFDHRLHATAAKVKFSQSV